MGLLGSIVGGLTGGLIGGVADHQSAKHNAGLSRENWIYQQSNAHQLEIEDLRKAGLNPILSATGGHMAGMSPVNPGSSGGAYANAITQAITSSKQLKMQEKLQSRELDIAQTNAETAKAKADTDLYKAQNESKLIDSQVVLNKFNSSLSLKQADLTIARTYKTYADIQEVFQRMRDNHLVSMATVDKLRSGATLDYATASKLASDIDKNSAEIGLINVKTGQIAQIMTDPKYLYDRKLWGDALAGNNALGNLHGIATAANEAKALLPGISFNLK